MRLIPFLKCSAVAIMLNSLLYSSVACSPRKDRPAAPSEQPVNEGIAKLPAGLKGNWYSPADGNWKLGIHGQHVIFDNKFWTCGAVENSGAEWSLDLQSGNEHVRIRLKKLKDSTLLYAIATSGFEQLRRVGRVLPAYQTKDTTPFYDSRFERIDTAVLSGLFLHAPDKSVVKLSMTDPIAGEPLSVYADVDASGRWEMRIPLLNTTQVTLTYGESYQVDVLEPGEKNLVFYDGKTSLSLAMGRNARFHNELANYKVFDLLTGAQPAELTADRNMTAQVFASCEAAYTKAAQAFEAEQALKPNLAYRTKTFITDYLRFSTASILMQERFSVAALPADLLAFVKKLDDNRPPAPATLISDYSMYLTDVIAYNIRLGNNFYNFDRLDLLERMLTEGAFAFTQQEIKAINSALKITVARKKGILMAMGTTDLPALDKEIDKIYSKYNKEINTIASEVAADSAARHSIDYIFQQYSAHPGLRNLLIARYMTNQYKFHFKAIDNKQFIYGLSRLKNDYLKRVIITSQANFTDLGSRAKSIRLPTNNHLRENASAKETFESAIRPFRGKIIYIDFWGTWCGPCLQQMQLVTDLKKKLGNRSDIVYMYFANNSPEDSWRNVISQFNLTGENTIHYRLPREQQAALERLLGINSYPTYLLVDRAGKVAQPFAPSPNAPELLQKMINQIP